MPTTNTTKWTSLLAFSLGLCLLFCAAPSHAQPAPAKRPETRSPTLAKKAPPTNPSQKIAKPAPPKASAVDTNWVDTQNRKVDPKWDQPYLLAAYGLIWLFIFIYLLVLTNKLRTNQQELRRLELRVEELDPNKE